MKRLTKAATPSSKLLVKKDNRLPIRHGFYFNNTGNHVDGKTVFRRLFQANIELLGHMLDQKHVTGCQKFLDFVSFGIDLIKMIFQPLLVGFRPSFHDADVCLFPIRQRTKHLLQDGLHDEVIHHQDFLTR